MKRFAIALMTIAAILLASAFAPGRLGEASNPGTPVPLLGCSDVNADSAVTISDIGAVVREFGSANPDVDFYPLYDLSGADGTVSIGDIGIAVLDFGIAPCPLVDTEIARATVTILDHPQRDQFIVENATFLATQGYYLSSTDVPGQGKHYVNGTYFDDDLFDPTRPEGLVYNNGRLVAQLYFVDGDAVGWGCWPGCSDDPPPDQVDIDGIPGGLNNMDPPCTPTPPNTACSWDDDEDGWHLHYDLCSVAIGHPSSAAIPGIGSAVTCQNLHNTWCGGSKCPNSTWRWDDRVGWMGHLWNWNIANPNGRFADCAPDETGAWKGFNCPQ